MRIIAGKWKGKPVLVPRMGTRPSTDRTRQALFSMLQNIIEGAAVLDLYAGSGALSLECLSRGALMAEAVDDDREACEVIRRNARSVGCRELQVHQKPVLEFLSQRRGNHEVSILFADPPYAQTFQGSQLQLLLSSPHLPSILAPEAFCILESPEEISPEDLASLPHLWNVVKKRSYGKSHVTILQLEK